MSAVVPCPNNGTARPLEYTPIYFSIRGPESKRRVIRDWITLTVTGKYPRFEKPFPFNLVRHRGGLSKDRSLFSYNYKACVNEIFFSFSYLKLLWRLSNIVHFSFRYVEWFLNRCFVFPFWNFDKDFGQEDRKFWAQVLKFIIYIIFRGGYWIVENRVQVSRGIRGES